MVRRLTWIAVAMALIGAMMAPPATAQTNREGRIRILGHGSVETVPDFVMVRVGISNRAASPTAALDQNSAIARKIVDFAKQFAISEQDIRSDSINLAQAFKSVREPNGSTQQVPDGYNASNFVRVKIADMPRLGTFMRQILDQGATNISGVSFGLSNPEKVADEARAKAMEDALHQAQQLAGSAKVKLGSILEIAHPPRIEFRAPVGEADLAVPRQRIAVPIEVGTVTVKAEVDVTWTIE
ncbi:MAG TPA: SIMPL domain-containing protein [Xanthobacteraceae bacterium]|nr:SIMPL domain-containing protein [Xanthobacteraceae bacterium]